MPNLVARTTRSRRPSSSSPMSCSDAPRAAVDVRRVEERDAVLERGVDHRARPVLVEPPAEVVAPEADRRDGELRASEGVLPHGSEHGSRQPRARPPRRRSAISVGVARRRRSMFASSGGVRWLQPVERRRRRRVPGRPDPRGPRAARAGRGRVRVHPLARRRRRPVARDRAALRRRLGEGRPRRRVRAHDGQDAAGAVARGCSARATASPRARRPRGRSRSARPATRRTAWCRSR